MIDGVLFDFGGVVIDSPFHGFTRLEERFGLPAGILRQVNSRDPDTNAWAQLERATIDNDTFVTLFEAEAAALGVTLDGRDVLDLLVQLPSGRAVARPVMLAAVAALRADGVPVGLLTNNIAPMDARPETAWVYDEFDAVIESCRLGVRKPDPQMYHEAARVLGVDLTRTVLLDDLGINLKAARALGVHTIKVVDPHLAVAELQAVLAD